MKSLLTDANTQASTHTGMQTHRHVQYHGYSSAGFLLVYNIQGHIQAVSVAKQDIVYNSWLAVLGFYATLTASVMAWRSVTHTFPGFLTPLLTQIFFPKPPTTFLTCFCKGKRQKYARKFASTGDQTYNHQAHH